MADNTFRYRFSVPSGDRPWHNNPDFKKKLQDEIASGLWVKGPSVLGKATGISYAGLAVGDCGVKTPTNDWVAITEEQYNKELEKKALEKKAWEEQQLAALKERILVRFDVNKVDPSTQRSKKRSHDSLVVAWQSLGAKYVEACSTIPENSVMLFDEQNLLARTVHKAFYDHHPLRLTPDSIWITIAQGFAIHINENAEKLRSKFVSHEGKKKIVISRPEFVKGSLKNDWVGVFPEFTSNIEAYIGQETVNMLQADFSTTTVVERTVSHIVVMDTVKSYFEYAMVCGCGIPYIELTGTVDDWEKIKKKASAMRSFDLDWWMDVLEPILDEFISAAKGNANVAFWTSICNLYGGSGIRRPISGWIQAFFPYLLAGKELGGRPRGPGKKGVDESKKRNEYMKEYQKSIQNKAQNDLKNGFGEGRGCGSGVDLKNIPSGISKVPFLYVDALSGKNYDMLFCGGVTTITQDEFNGTLEPKVGWAVLEI